MSSVQIRMMIITLLLLPRLRVQEASGGRSRFSNVVDERGDQTYFLFRGRGGMEIFLLHRVDQGPEVCVPRIRRSSLIRTLFQDKVIGRLLLRPVLRFVFVFVFALVLPTSIPTTTNHIMFIDCIFLNHKRSMSTKTSRNCSISRSRRRSVIPRTLSFRMAATTGTIAACFLCLCQCRFLLIRSRLLVFVVLVTGRRRRRRRDGSRKVYG